MQVKRRFQIVPLAMVGVLLGTAFLASWGQQSEPTAPTTPAGESTVLIDDFSTNGQKSALGAKWAFQTDRVMGGVSTGKMQFEEHEGRRCLHLTGSVSLDNNGGFIQARVALHPRGRNFDARAFEGILLRVKGNSESYAVHLRAQETRFPWQYYDAAFKTNGQWQEIKLPFAQFKPASMRTPGR